MPVAWQQPLRANKIHFDLVLYDTKTEVPAGHSVFSVRVHTLGNAPYPFYTLSKSRRMTLRHENSFTVKSFVDRMFRSIFNAKSHLLRYQHEKALNLYFKNADDTEQKLPERNENTHIAYILTRLNVWRQFHECLAFTGHEQFEMEMILFETRGAGVVHLDLFMIETANRDTTKHRVRIKFAVDIVDQRRSQPQVRFSATTPIEEVESMRWVGMPLIVWVDRHDTLQQVMDSCLDDKVRPLVEYSYRVIPGQRVVPISTDRREKYNVCSELGENDFIVFKLSATAAYERFNSALPVFPRSIHEALHG